MVCDQIHYPNNYLDSFPYIEHLDHYSCNKATHFDKRLPTHPAQLAEVDSIYLVKELIHKNPCFWNASAKCYIAGGVSGPEHLKEYIRGMSK